MNNNFMTPPLGHKEVAGIQDFKVKATTAFVAAQMVVAAAFALLKLF